MTVGSYDLLERFIISAYRDLFDRAPDPGGLAYWRHRLASGTSRDAVARALAATVEYRAAAVTAAFLTHIDHLPTPEQLRTWVEHLADGGTITDLEGALQGGKTAWNRSNQYLPQWGEALFRTTTDVIAVDGYGNRFDGSQTGETTRRAIATLFMRSTEHLTLLIDRFYRSTLDRPVDAGALRFWLRQAATGRPLEALRPTLLASDEYLRRATA